ncbi:MAG: YnbE family lipoprotein [Gammaproteobacteria bacterium]|nr:YnbE family lipoprotein [Gammaproteobacteria bacterium]
MKNIARSFCILALLGGCTPTVQVQAPDKPIEINLNVNIEHSVKVEIDRDVQQAISQNKDIF